MGGLVPDLLGAGIEDMADRGTEMHVVSLYDEETVMGWVHQTLAGIKDNSSAGPDGVRYRLIKAV